MPAKPIVSQKGIHLGLVGQHRLLEVPQGCGLDEIGQTAMLAGSGATESVVDAIGQPERDGLGH
jgi:hypothetical protein